MSSQLTETLVVSARRDHLVTSLKNPSYHIHTEKDPGRAMETLRATRFDLIVLDEELFAADLVSVVREIKRRIPLVPVLILSRSTDRTYQTDLMEAGADDLLTADLSADELQRRLRLILRQRRQARMLAQRNQNLQSINILSRRMHGATEPMALIEDTIDRASATFKLYGMAVVLQEGDAFQLYAGREGCSSDGTFYETIVSLKEYDPFRRVTQSGVVQVFQNIVADPNYVPIPALPSPESAIILPLAYQEHRFGALAVFGTGQHPLSHDDLLIYELFTSQFAVALNNARFYHAQRISAQSSQHLLRAWQRFINLQTTEEVCENLQQLVEEIPNVTRSLVWMYGPDLTQNEIIVNAGNQDVFRAFRQVQEDNQMDVLIRELDERHMEPLLVQSGVAQEGALAALFKAMRGQTMMLVPIQDSARFIGAIVAGVINNRQYSSDDARILAAGLAHAAGLALERGTLIQNMAEKSGRLEALLRSTPQGIFFVEEGGPVAFCNPQFTELTAINPSEVLYGSPDQLLGLVADRATDSARALQDLQDARARLLSDVVEIHEDYPIVEIALRDSAQTIVVEFVVIGDLDGTRRGWAGIIRDYSHSKNRAEESMLLLDTIAERIRIPYSHLRGLTATLEEQHSRFSHRERARLIHQMEDNVSALGHLWDNFLEMFHLDVSSQSLRREPVDLYEIVQRVVDHRSFAEQRRYLQIEAPAHLPQLELDEARIEQALHNVVSNAVRFSPPGSPVLIRLEHLADEVRVTVQDQGVGIPTDQLGRVFEPFFRASNNPAEDGAGLGLYLAQQTVRRHGGQMWAESQPGHGAAVTIVLPVTDGAPVSEPLPEVVEPARPERAAEPPPSQPDRQPGARRVSERPMQTIMVVEGRSRLVSRLVNRLQGHDYELITYRSGEEALRDVNSIRLDLILLDVGLPDANGLDVCERMCKRTEVPLIMLADEPSDAEKVRSLMIGADDYIAEPIGDDELMARVNVIFKRRRLPDRTREPLDLGTLYVDFARREVFLNNKSLELTRIEYDLLHTLAVNQGQVLTHKQLLEKVWGPEYQAETQYLWVNVSRLRKKLEPTPDSPRFIHTQPGVGYVFRPS